MNKTIKMTLFMGIVAMVAGLCITLVNDLTAPIIADNDIAEEKANLELMFPGGNFALVDSAVNDEDILGVYVVEGFGHVVKVQGTGYGQTPIIALVALDEEKTVADLKILQQQETAGFGSRCFEDDFMNSAYIGKKADEEVDMLSGATYTSTAMKEMIAKARMALGE